MFGRKAPPAGAEALPAEQHKLIRRGFYGRYTWERVNAAEKAQEKGWAQALALIIRRDDFPADWRGELVRRAIAQDNAGMAACLADTLTGLKADIQRRPLISVAMADDNAARQVFFARTYHPDAYALALRGILTSEEVNNAMLAPLHAVLDAGLMNIHYEGASVMQAALQGGHVETAKKLTAAGFRIDLYQQDLEKHATEKSIGPAAREYLRALYGAPAPAQKAEPPAPSDGAFQRLDDYSLSYVAPLPQGGRLTMVFNFALSQQVVVVEAGGQLSAPAVVPFSQIENRALLQEAVDAFAAQGGSAQLPQLPAASLRLTPPKGDL